MLCPQRVRFLALLWNHFLLAEDIFGIVSRYFVGCRAVESGLFWAWPSILYSSKYCTVHSTVANNPIPLSHSPFFSPTKHWARSPLLLLTIGNRTYSDDVAGLETSNPTTTTVKECQRRQDSSRTLKPSGSRRSSRNIGCDRQVPRQFLL